MDQSLAAIVRRKAFNWIALVLRGEDAGVAPLLRVSVILDRNNVW